MGQLMHTFIFLVTWGEKERGSWKVRRKGRAMICGWGGREREGGMGPDADVSAVTLVAIVQQQGLPFLFIHWLASLTTSHVVWETANERKATLLLISVES